MSCIPTLAQNFYVNGLNYTILSSEDRTVEVSRYNNEPYSDDINIPENITFEDNTYTVTGIGFNAFKNCSNLTSISLPNTITNIGYSAFHSCTGLTSISIPKSVTSIGVNAFYNCNNLTEVNISDLTAWCNIDFENGASNPLRNDRVLKLNGDIITELVIPNEITEIKKNTFYGCSSFKSAIIHDNVTSIGERAFFNCSQMESITIGSKLNRIDIGAFVWCYKLLEVNISDLSAWCNIDFSSTFFCESQGQGKLILNGEEITNLTIPDKITEIKPYSFADIDLSSVRIHNNVTKIGAFAFNKCIYLNTINIPSSITDIEGGAFENCSQLQEVNIEDLSAWCKINFGTWDSNPLYYAHYLKINDNEIEDFELPEDLTEIKKYTFINCSNIQSVTIPKNVSSIGKYSFAYCWNLNSVTSLNSVPPTCDEGVFDELETANIQLNVPSMSLNDYKNANIWCDFFIKEQTTKLDKIHHINNIEISRYDTSGRLCPTPSKGINFVKMSNGIIKKVIVK